MIRYLNRRGVVIAAIFICSLLGYFYTVPYSKALNILYKSGVSAEELEKNLQQIEKSVIVTGKNGMITVRVKTSSDLTVDVIKVVLDKVHSEMRENLLNKYLQISEQLNDFRGDSDENFSEKLSSLESEYSVLSHQEVSLQKELSAIPKQSNEQTTVDADDLRMLASLGYMKKILEDPDHKQLSQKLSERISLLQKRLQDRIEEKSGIARNVSSRQDAARIQEEILKKQLTAVQENVEQITGKITALKEQQRQYELKKQENEMKIKQSEKLAVLIKELKEPELYKTYVTRRITIAWLTGFLAVFFFLTGVFYAWDCRYSALKNSEDIVFAIGRIDCFTADTKFRTDVTGENYEQNI